MEVGKKLAEFAATLKYEHLSVEAVDTVRRLFIDFIGLALRGAGVESSYPVIDFVKKAGQGQGTAAVVIGTELRARPEYSCMANGCFAHSLELDDVVNEASLHPGAVVFPAALAAGEIVGSAGRDFITAVVIGYEIMARLGRAVNPASHYRRGFHPTGTCGTFASAVVVGKLIRLDERQLLSAFGIASSQAAASMEFLTEGAWTKRLHPGWAAHSGFISAMLARAGFQGPSRGIEGKYGFLNSYSDSPSPELAVEGLGGSFLISRTSIKPHACCRYNQSPIDAIIGIVSRNGILPQQVKSVKVGLVSPAMQIVGEPIDVKRNPQNVVEAQFSLPYAVAISILKRQAFLDEYDPSLIHESQVKKLMEKVDCYIDPDLEREFPQKWPCTVEIKTDDSKVFREKLDYPRGDPQNPLNWEELISKFESLTESMDIHRRREIIEKVHLLENIDNINELTALLSGDLR